MKKVLATVLVLCMLLTCASFPATAETTNPYRVKIFTMGDSFTQGVIEQNAYRYYIYEPLIKDGAVFEFIGPSTSGDFRVSDLYKKHGGVGGAIIGCADDYKWNGSGWVTNSWEYTNPNTSKTIKTSGNKNSIHYRLFAGSDGTNDYTKTEYGNYVAQADIVTLYIGLNDYYSSGTTGLSADIEHVKQRYYTVVDRIYEINPDVSLYVTSLNEVSGLRGYGKTEAENTDYANSLYKYNEFVLNDVVEHYTEKGYKIQGISLNQDGYKMVSGDTPSDDGHPNHKGNRKIGTQIYMGIKDEVLALNAQGSNVAYNPTRVTSIALDKTSATLKTGENLTVTSTIAPANAEIITTIFTSSDESVATVDYYGRITAVGAGTATIKATALDSLRPGATEISATCTVTVTNDTYEKVGDNFLPVFHEKFDATGPWTGSTDKISASGSVFKSNNVASASITSKKTVDLDTKFSMAFNVAVMGHEMKEVTASNRNTYYASLTVGKYQLRVGINGKTVGFYYDGTLKAERVFNVPVTRQNDDRYTLAKDGATVYVYRNNELLFTSTVDEYDTAEGQVIIATAGYGTMNLRDVELKSIRGLVKLDPTAIKYSTATTSDGKDYPIANALDGDLSTDYSVFSWKGEAPVEWTTDARFVVLDLGDYYDVTNLNIYWGHQGGTWGRSVPDAYNVSYSADNSTYTPAKSYSGIYDILVGNTTESYSSVNTSFVMTYPSWASGTNRNVYGYGNVKESELGWEGVRYIKIEMTSVTYNPTIAEIEVFATQYMEGEEPDGTTTSYTVNYVDKSGKALETPKTVSGVAIGDEVTENALEIDGYEVDKTSATITLKASGNVITFTYTRVYSTEPVKLSPISITSPFSPKGEYTLYGIIDGSEAANSNYFRADVNITSSGVKGNDNNLNFTADFGVPHNITSIYTAFGSKFATGVAIWGSNDNATWTELADLTLSAQRSTTDINHEGYYRYIKVEAYATKDSDPAILEVTFYGTMSFDYAKVTGMTVSDVTLAKDTYDKDTLVDGDISNSTVNSFIYGWSNTSKTFEVVLPEATTVSTLGLYWGLKGGAENDYNIRPAKTYEIFFAGEDGVYGNAVYSHDDTTLAASTPRGTNRNDVVSFNTPVEGVKKIKVVISNYYESGCLAIREFEAFEFIGSTEPEAKTATYTVNYVDTEGKPVATAKNGTGNVGDVVTENAVAVDGYTVDKDSATITLIDGTNTITFTYTKVVVAESVKLSPSNVTSINEAADTSNTVWKIFDGNYGTTWGQYFKVKNNVSTTAKGEGQFIIEMDFGRGYNFTELAIAGLSCYTTGFALYGRNSATDAWVELGDFAPAGRAKETFAISHTGNYRYLKFEGYKFSYTGPVGIEELELYGVAGGETVIIDNANVTATVDGAVAAAITDGVNALEATSWAVYNYPGDYSMGDGTSEIFSIYFDLGAKYDLQQLFIRGGEVRPTIMNVYVSNDNATWGDPVATITPAYVTETTYWSRYATVVLGDLGGEYRYVKLEATKLSMDYTEGKKPAIHEIIFYEWVENEADEPETPVEPERKPITITPAGVSAPTNTDGKPFSFATDGDNTTFYAVSGYYGALTSTNYQMVFDIGYLGTVDSLDILWGDSSWGNTTPNAYKVEVSSDGTTWTEKKSYSGIYDITTGAATDTISGENTVFGITTSAWAITNQPAQVNAYTQGNILEKNLGWTDVRYVRVTVTSVQYRLAIAEVTISSLPNEDQIILSKGGQIRIADTDNNITAGLRFGASILKMNAGIVGDYKYSEDAEIKFGMFMLPEDMLGGKTLAEYLANGVQAAVDVPAKKILSQDENFITFTAVLTGIPKSAYNRNIVAVPYMLKGGEYTYFEEMTKNYKSVARAARSTTYSDSAIAAITDETLKAEMQAIADELDEIISYMRTLPFSRGVNVNRMETFLSENTYGAFEDGIEDLTNEATYTNIKSKGFDHVRIPVNFYTIYFEAPTGKYGYTTEQLMQHIDTAIDLATKNGLYVILDFHGWFYIGSKENDYEDFLHCWTQVANRYKDYSDMLIFELLNEPWYTNGNPQTYLSDSRLNQMQVEAINIIRNTGSNNADRLIICCTADGNKAWKLSALSEELKACDNIAIAIHEYEPKSFTHQNFSWDAYGGKTTTLEAAGGVGSVDYDFGLIKKFMEETGIPVVLGEFGLNLDKATDEDVDTYIRYITTFCETNNIPWTYWQYRDGYSSEGSMSLYRKTSYFGSVQWDEDALNALFLR